MSEPNRPPSPDVPAIDLGSELRHYRQMSEAAMRAFEPMRQAMLAAPGIATKDLAATYLRNAADIARFQSTMSQIDRLALSVGPAGINRTLADSAAKAMAAVHPDLERAARISAELARTMTVPDSLLRNIDAAMLAERHIMADIGKVASLQEVMRSMLAGFNVSTLSRPDYLPVNGWVSATSALASLSKAHSVLQHLASPLVEGATQAAERFAGLPTFEYYCGVDLATTLSARPLPIIAPDARRVIRARVRTEPIDPVDTALADLGGDLQSMWLGAKHARTSANPDRIRHFAVSIRELLRTLLHKMAPDDAVRAWSSNQTDFTHGRPTRGARLRYICRATEAEPLQDFILKDIEALLAYDQLLELGTHGPAGALPSDAAEAMEVRMESTIRFLVSVHKASSHG